jgi:ABC-type lipoprotein export system ATPase subunit
MIELEHVSRIYMMGDEPLHALDDISEVIDAGEYVAVMGPSGSGKSTLLNVVGCLDRPTQGLYRLDGQEVGSLSDDAVSAIRRLKIGFVFQTFHLIPRLSAAENVGFPMIFAGAGLQVQALLERMNADGLTLVLVTHNPAVAGRAGRVLIMQDGGIVARQSGGELAGLPTAAAAEPAP